ncbi:Ig-like domain-containing protein [Bifidobacterium jacchi]|uniref:Ig domain-containing protein n=1 Tax=Bifidobacterium jacchi TaxID=2490545 RepID=A0A5N5RGW4_9BIFI|nr:Ig-like domain-containing protein [Bifidobacterium jacchi]KAB5606170.1 Ig domain-containing protein [Bifidobacterium jacchi]
MASSAMNDSSLVTLGKFQVGGYAYAAPYGTPLPENATDPLDPAFELVGYLSEDGVTNSVDSDTTTVNDANGTTVLNVISSYSETYQFTLIETLRASAARLRYGTGNVTGEDKAMTIRHMMPDDERFSIVFEIVATGSVKDRLVIGNASRSEFGDRQMHSGDVVGYDVTLAANEDSRLGQGVTSIEYFAAVATPAKPVTGVSLTPQTATVAVDASTELTVAFTPTDADDQSYKAVSSDQSKATVAVDGLKVTVTGKAATDAGKPVTITVTSTDGAKNATATVTVPPKA